jgi:hypothetical protein
VVAAAATGELGAIAMKPNPITDAVATPMRLMIPIPYPLWC